jgi:hypothetical protein
MPMDLRIHAYAHAPVNRSLLALKKIKKNYLAVFACTLASLQIR